MKKLPEQYDSAIVGVVERCGQEPFVAYDEAKLLDLLTKEHGSRVDALEYFEFNIKGAWLGDDTPGFVIGWEERADD